MQRFHHVMADTSRELAGVPRKSNRNLVNNSISGSTSSPTTSPRTNPQITTNSPSTMRNIAKAIITKGDTPNNKRNSFSTASNNNNLPRSASRRSIAERQRSRSPSARNNENFDFNLSSYSSPSTSSYPYNVNDLLLPFSPPESEQYPSPLVIDTSPLSQANALNEVIKVVQHEINSQDLNLFMSDIHRGYTHAQRKDMHAQDSTILELTTTLEHKNESLLSLEKEIHTLRGADREAKEARARAAEAEVALASALAHAHERVSDLERQWRDAEKRADTLSIQCRNAEEALAKAIILHRKELLEATTSLQAQVTSLSAMVAINQAMAIANDGASTPGGRGTPVPDDEDAPDDEPPTPLLTISNQRTSPNKTDANNSNNTRTSVFSGLKVRGRKDTTSPNESTKKQTTDLPSPGFTTDKKPRRNSGVSEASSDGHIAARSIIQHPEDTASVISKAIEDAVEARLFGLQQDNKQGSMVAELENKIQTLELALHTAEKDVAELRNDVLAARGERDALHSTIVVLKADIAGKEILQREIQELRTSLEESEASKEQFSHDVRKYAAERDVLHQTVMRLTAERDRLSSLDLHVRTLELRLQEAQQGGNNAEHSAKLASQEIDQMKKQFEDEQHHHERAIMNEINKREHDVAVAKAETAKVTKQLHETEDKLQSITSAFEEEKNKNREELSKHSSYIDHASTNIQELKSQIHKLEQEIQQNKTIIQTDNQTVEKLQDELQHNIQENRNFRKQIEILTGERDTIKATLTAVKEIFSTTNDELDQTKERLQKVEEKLQQYINIPDLSPQLKETQTELHRTSASLAVAIGERDALKNTLSAVKEALNEESDKSSNLERRIQQLEKEIINVKQESLLSISKSSGIPAATKEAVRRAIQAEGERDALMNMVTMLKGRIAELETEI